MTTHDTDKTDTGNKLTLAPNNYWQKIDTNNKITLMTNWYWQQTDPYSKLKLTTNWDWQQMDTDDKLTLTNWHWQQYVLLANWLILILTGILTIESGTDNKLRLKLNLCGNKLFQNGILTHLLPVWDRKYFCIKTKIVFVCCFLGVCLSLSLCRDRLFKILLKNSMLNRFSQLLYVMFC